MEKLTNRKIIADINTLSALAQKKLPVKVGFAIAKNFNKIESILNAYNKEREKIIDKYCLKDEEGNRIINEDNTYAIPAKFKKEFNTESNELLDIENEIDIHKFKLEALDNTEIPIVELQAIEYMITEE